MSSLLSRLEGLGAEADESTQRRLDRQLLVFGGSLMSLGGIVWGSLAFANGMAAEGLIPFSYALLTAVNFSVLARRRRQRLHRIIQVVLSLALPFLFQWALGGFVRSGGVMLWAMIALVGSLTFSSARQSFIWLGLYCLLTLVSGVLDERFAAASAAHPGPHLITAFFVLNVTFISAIVFSLAILLTGRQRAAIGALEAQHQVSAALSAQLAAAVEAREGDIARLRTTEDALRELSKGLTARVDAKTAQLRFALQRAEAATRAKTEFLATMSHEIRTPLNGILATTDLLQTTSLDPLQRESLALVRRSGELLSVILNDVLDFSRIEAGKLELVTRSFDPRSELEAVAGLHRPVAEKKGVALRVSVAEPFPRLVSGDAHRLNQVLGNLLGNAVKFTPSGAIELSAHATAEGEGWRLRFAVADSGVGIPQAVLPRLFQPFSQGDASTTRQFGGSGLGLSICARLVEKLGGEISATSAPGVGTTFSFDVFVQRAEETSPVVALPPLPEPGGTVLRALLVEDNPVNQMVARRLLERLGCTVQLANDGVEAIEAHRSATFDVVLMDLQMPRLDGLGATRQIRKLALQSQPFIVALTANAFESDVAACKAAGMDDFLPKPLRLDELRRVLQRVSSSVSSAAIAS